MPVMFKLPPFKRPVAALLALLLPLLLGACAGISALERGQHMDALAAASHWKKLRLVAGDFVLTAYVPPAPDQPAGNKVLTVYIEGDGMAWLTASQPSDNPTPRKPVSLELALAHPQGAAAYLARPCQNVVEADWGNCAQPYWTDRRYAPEVVAASDQAISALKAHFKAEQLILVGYSGGGAVAALVAARRPDVVRLATLAGNLDIRAWTAQHRILPLTGSLNPADEWANLQHIPQWHFVGGKDAVVSAEVVRAYIDRFPAGHRPVMQVLPGVDHACCWVAQWPALARQVLP